jgi:hypothetical protein
MERWSEGRWKSSYVKGWKGRIHNREEWKKLLRTAKNRRIVHMPMEWMKWIYSYMFSSTCHRACLWPLSMLCRSNTLSWVRDCTSFTIITSLKAGRPQNRRSIREERGAFSLQHGPWLICFFPSSWHLRCMGRQQTAKSFSVMDVMNDCSHTPTHSYDVSDKINPLKTKRRPLYLKTQSVPRCKHFSSWL